MSSVIVSTVTPKAVIRMSEMSQEMLDYAVAQTLFAQETFSTDQEVAHHLKKVFEEKYQPTWHCLVGRSFSCFVTHENKCSCYFYIGQTAVMIWKTSS